eukprot:15437211-Alexandrium_andersonii.AAC.1
MSPFCSQRLLPRTSAHHAVDPFRAGDLLRAADQRRVVPQARALEGGRGVHQRRGLRTYRLRCAGRSSSVGLR